MLSMSGIIQTMSNMFGFQSQVYKCRWMCEMFISLLKTKKFYLVMEKFRSSALLVLVALVVVASAKYSGPTNQAGVNLIKEFEGFRANFYNDAVGIKTVGYGHACHALPCTNPIYGKFRVPLTQADGEGLLQEDLKRGGYESCVTNEVTYSGLTANQYSALVSFVFNLGCPNFKSSTLLKKINAGDVAGASGEFGKWVKAGGKTLPGLVRRREAEKSLFCNGANCGAGSGSGGSGGGAGSCIGTITASALNVRSSPNSSSSISGSLTKGTTVTLESRVSGTNVSGNPYWFKVSNGYVSAYYVDIASNNGASWCKKN